jgi:Flp pilus assembly protein TadD
MKRWLALFLFVCLWTQSAGAAGFDLRLDLLTKPLSGLAPGDRRLVDESIALIKQGEHAKALAVLSEVNKNTTNPGLKVILSYALLQVGDKVGAFGEAAKAESAQGANSYVCYFLAKVAAITGDQAACQRELEHVKKSGELKAEVKALEKELKAKPAAGRS